MVRLSSATAALLAITCRLVSAQIYQFDKVPLPESHSLHTLYAFYVYSHQEAPERTLGNPFVKFHDMSSHSTDSSRPDASLVDYKAAQLSILPYRNFWKLINPDKFCSTAEDVKAGSAKAVNQLFAQKSPGEKDADVNLYTHTLGFYASEADKPADRQLPVHSTGVYILVFSNCGDFSNGQVTGSVIVKNAYGFLPGNEYHKMPFYGWMSMLYAMMAIVWMALSLRYWKELFHIQYCVAVVILLGLVETFLWWRFFGDWNESGTRGRFLFILAILASVTKSIFSYMLVLVGSLGWGVTRPYLDQWTITKVQLTSFIYIVLDFIRESVLSFRHSHSLSIAFVLLCLLPVAVLNGIIFYWIFTALSGLMDTLAERKQQEKLLLFQRLWKILIVSLALASCSVLFQLFDLSRSISIRWHYQWFFVDGVSHILFCLVLMAMMYLWAPHTNSQRYAYKQVDSYEEKAETKAADKEIWADEGALDDDDDDDSFWASTRGKGGSVKPSTIGAGDEDDFDAA
eukprot:TRINITY_DN49046_c0_g1_i1.p1 TRINITY_DN49046_c0_g1~~TRINITY_DN49046_c0_g1_i1.p1  ORF type:complete len:514 (+),score=70.05 TRINITY_DN49046_c0_g1_i1:40-1581(+)